MPVVNHFQGFLTYCTVNLAEFLACFDEF